MTISLARLGTQMQNWGRVAAAPAANGMPAAAGGSRWCASRSHINRDVIIVLRSTYLSTKLDAAKMQGAARLKLHRDSKECVPKLKYAVDSCFF